MYVKPIEGSPKPAFIKVFETFEEIAMVLLLEDDGYMRYRLRRTEIISCSL